MAMSDRTAELYELADHVAFDSELKRILTGKRLHDLADQWKAERQACKSAVEEADRLRFAAEAQAAADRAALAQAQEALTEDREKWSFDTALYVGALLLAKVYPENVFTGASGDPGPTYIAALRDALRTYAQRNELAQARALLTELYDDSPCRFDHHGHCQEHNSMTDVCIMRRIAAALSGGAR